ncbi:MAG: putative PNPLA domain-containing protein [Nitrospira sp.]|nr:MAG: putative PNPLA domain-containing protein [Nitrospira sp.]
MPVRSILNSIFVVWTISFSAACGILNFDRGSNDFLEPSPVLPVESGKELAPFIGVAISGGGSRAANFAAAVLQELERYGFLQHVTAISGVSGGTLPAAYYALNRNRPDWDWAAFRNLMGTNFYRSFLWKHFGPWGLLNYLNTEYNRSDMMADVFDDVLFRGAKFEDLDPSLPVLLINAAPLHTASRGQWSFTEASFRELKSNLKTFSISRAVAASTAVPGIFNGIALRAYKEDRTFRYRHLVDGGISENLGVEALLQLYVKSRKHDFTGQMRNDEGAAPRGCFIFAVDSFPDKFLPDELSDKRDLRSGIDFIIDRNLLTTFDIMGNNARDRFFAMLQHGVHIDGNLFPVMYRPWFEGYRCQIWHIHSGNLMRRFLFRTERPNRNGDFLALRETLAQVIPEIKTHWKLEASGTCSSAALQEALYATATMLVTEDRMAHNLARDWFVARGLRLGAEKPKDFDESQYDRFKNLRMELKHEVTGGLRLMCNDSP